ncbi:hypothetical protein [Dysgonomonas sp. HGC4]|uniref:hypothetical protein n=1 Tax=Dysgonomonas sp. HGC4 TaxID=1658009 RepID=UPI0006824343|nr:hypothetical protein [Dysgonomonas sp. HGC4]MBD8349754.1 hypothetical protein [Dysgonomonas sp. HGC4]
MSIDKRQLKNELKFKIDLFFKRIYILAGNIYIWFWLIRAMFFRENTTFEDYIQWAFLSFGFYLFIQNNDEIFFKDKNGNKL